MSATDRARTAMQAASDAASFALIFDRHVEPIYRYIVKRVGSSLAEDLTAEAFARAYEQRTRFASVKESARPWLYGIATNLIHNARRAEQRQLLALSSGSRRD